MTTEFSDAELEAYVDESLDPLRAAEVERALKTDRALLRKLSWINGRRDAGVHSLGEIWRQAQIGVPDRAEVVRWVAGQLPRDEADYLQFRVDTLKCRFTAALLDDVRQSATRPAQEQAESRRKKIFTSSEKLLKPKKRRG